LTHFFVYVKWASREALGMQKRTYEVVNDSK